MSKSVSFQIDLPPELPDFRLPSGVQDRLTELLDRQDSGKKLSARERSEAEGLVNLAELLSLIKLRANRV